MVYLSRQGYRVVGVEGVRKAVEEFAQAPNGEVHEMETKKHG